MNLLGSILGNITIFGGSALFIYSAFKTEAGFAFIRTLALFGLIIGVLGTLGFAFNIDFILTPLASLFGYLKSFMYLWNFVIPINDLFSYIGILLSFLAFYWSVLGVLFVVKFFNK